MDFLWLVEPKNVIIQAGTLTRGGRSPLPFFITSIFLSGQPIASQNSSDTQQGLASFDKACQEISR